MGLFSKKDSKKEMGVPKLPELPSLPTHFPEIEDDPDEGFPRLPSFPTSKMGDRFSQETIKNAVSGDEDEEEMDDFEDGIIPRPEPLQRPIEKNRPKPNYEMPERRESQMPKRNISPTREMGMEDSRTGPVFVRIDKFEESLKIFKETKDKIEEIETLLSHTKSIKEKEEEELINWEKEIQEMKSQVEKIDRDIFSKI
ncbi:MAG: hypothetical protein KKB62_01540 [Nanoarchaeota archaeon]|nr:hypothetical protein [Nanoarchaeota archaeon]